ncbi:Abi family protein [Shouchella clausii]|uniref:Abi family protein n=1 Tax=Shouchella clausii TaxID=79880 RepID=UPI0015CA3EB3|nr:Abi family protein [Shouchella clausii]
MEKNYTTLRGRLDKLRARGMDIPKDKEKERGVIKRYNYYNLINGYKDPFLTDSNNYPAYANPNEDYYLSGTTPSHLEALYIFDENLRKIFLERLLKIEERLKDVIVQSFYEHHSDMGKKKKIAEILHRESEYLRQIYYDLSKVETYVVSEKSGHRYTVIGSKPKHDDTIMRRAPKPFLINKDEIYHSLVAILYKQIVQQRKKNKSISSYLEKHTYLPMWILSNIMTFGNVSKLFEILTLDVQLMVLKKLGLNGGSLPNNLKVLNASRIIHILGLFRNSCAHNERFYCSHVYTPIDDEYMEYIYKFPQASQVNRLKSGTKYLNRQQSQKLDRYRHSIYTVMFCISLFLKQGELTKFKNDVKRELQSLKSTLPSTPYKKVERLMGLDFDWDAYLIK